MTIAGEFRRRAFHEARRYGGDAWVFVRELLQNSRDARAGRVDLVVERRDGFDRIQCRDDGCGMTFDHAQRYLFTLYASSKSGDGETAGRFGIGFWAVLRFEPDEIVVRSAPVGEPGWQLRMSGDLEQIERSGASLGSGTEIELVRRARGRDPVAEVWNAVRRDARHLRAEDGGILDVRVNSRRATAEIELDPPSLSFSRSGLHGAVALTDQPQVDLLAHGLRVRTAATLDELLTQPDRRRRRRLNTPEGLVPKVILDSRRLQVLMARGDARTDRELRQLVAAGRRGVRRLVRGQLDRGAGLGWIRRAGMRFLELLPATRRTRGLAVGLVMAMLLAGGIWGGWGSDRGLGSGSRRLEVISQGHARPDLILKTEATDRYLGPAADRLEALPAGLPLRYLPSIAEPLLSVFRVVSLDNGGRVVPPAQSSGPRPYLGAACHESCLEIELGLDGLSGEIRLPVPTGHLLDTDSLRVEGGAGVLWAAPDGGPLLEIDGIVKGRVRYRTGAGLENQPSASGSWPVLPESADVLALSLRSLEAREAARVATDWVRRKVVYDTSQATVDRHRAAAGQDLAFARRCLEVGAGDCDVQNALLAAVLARAGLSVRMAVGFVGSQGRALPGLHAWVEYRSESGAWRAVDASRGAPPNSIPHSYPEVTTIPHQADEDEMPARSGAAETTSRIGLPSRTLVGLLSAILLALAGSWWFIRRRWAVRRVQSEEAPDLAGLLKGALARPEAYAEVPALFARRVVPVLGSSTISLDRARSLSRSGRLAVSFGSSEFARRAAEQGQLVIDGSRPEGKAVAATLGAIDLDRWDQIVRMSHEEPVTEVLEQAAQRVGEAWRVVIGSGLADEVIVLDVPLAGRCPVVVVDEGSALWKRVLGLTVDDPSMAVFVLADQVVERLQSPPGRKRRLLSRLAAEAVLERAGVSP